MAAAVVPRPLWCPTPDECPQQSSFSLSSLTRKSGPLPIRHLLPRHVRSPLRRDVTIVPSSSSVDPDNGRTTSANSRPRTSARTAGPSCSRIPRSSRRARRGGTPSRPFAIRPERSWDSARVGGGAAPAAAAGCRRRRWRLSRAWDSAGRGNWGGRSSARGYNRDEKVVRQRRR